jgi:hypothetical protein
MTERYESRDYEQDRATTRSIADRIRREWGTRLIDPGDSHVKGERSLCVGEAA